MGRAAQKALRLGVWLVLGVALGAWGCKHVVAPPGPARAPRPYTVMGRTYYPLATAKGYREEGLASWYGPGFHGRRTSSGEPYDMHAMTAAHKTLPFNTWVKVTDLDTGRSVVVRINDRGPFVPGRIIDLSRAAAKRLGIVGKGVARVRVEALGYKTASGYRQPPSYTAGLFAVQVGSFVVRSNAEALAQRLSRRWGKVRVVSYDRGDRIFYRVWVGECQGLAQARRLRQALLGVVPQAFVVRISGQEEG